MDLKWQLALLNMRAKRYFQRTDKKITINGSDTAGYDKTKVECFNFHKMRHFAKECRSPWNQESRPRNQDCSRKTVNVEDTSSKAMVEIDEAGFDWSYMADDEAPTNMALMAFSNSKVQNSKTCSNTCLKSFETLKTQYDNLRIEFNKSEFDLATYKRGLASLEEQLVFYKKNEVMFCDQITVLKDASFRDSEINALNLQIEKLKKEKENLGFASYNVVTPPPIGLFAPSSIDLSNSGLEEFQHPEFKGFGPKDSKSVYGNRVTSAIGKQGINVVKSSTCWVWRPKVKVQDHVSKNSGSYICKRLDYVDPDDRLKSVMAWVSKKTNYLVFDLQGDPQDALNDQGYFDNRCSRHMIRNISYLTDFKEHDGGYVAFGGGAKSGKITGKGTIKTGKLDFEDAYFVKELKSTKDETSRILKRFIIEIENLVDKKVKIIRCDNGTKFKNRVMNEFRKEKGTKREYSVAKTPQQNKVAE
uniref:Putative ribonuclease H-like domain-containing protein n=1 Tax=Tanacetum cinerariifolium TaxID=118510 RepID=A0A699JXA1_TANCI|nr:putative ribonuclease H-like domain-containing protein [Tanacetum cinerariifolium]